MRRAVKPVHPCGTYPAVQALRYSRAASAVRACAYKLQPNLRGGQLPFVGDVTGESAAAAAAAMRMLMFQPPHAAGHCNAAQTLCHACSQPDQRHP